MRSDVVRAELECALMGSGRRHTVYHTGARTDYLLLRENTYVRQNTALITRSSRLSECDGASGRIMSNDIGNAKGYTIF